MQGTRVRSLVWKIPHATEQLSPRATTTEPTCHNYWSPHAWSPCSATREATAVRSPHTATKSSPCSPQLEKTPVQQERPSAAKRKKERKKNLPRCEVKTIYEDIFIYWPCIDSRRGMRVCREMDVHTGNSWNELEGWRWEGTIKTWNRALGVINKQMVLESKKVK